MYLYAMSPTKTTKTASFLEKAQDSLIAFAHFLMFASIYLFRRIRYNHVMLYCSSLSYSLLVSFVPLVASLSLFAAKAYELNKTKINIFLSQKEVNALILKFLPYSSHEIDIVILKLLKNAITIGWIGSIGLFVSTFLLYGTLEEIFNDAWKTRGRPIYRNILMVLFLLLLFVIAFGLYVKLGKFHHIRGHLLLYLLFKVTSLSMLVFSFALLFKLIPTARVYWKSAFAGGAFSALFYEGCRLGLHFYITKMFAYNKIWGSLSLIPIFILTIYALSMIIVLGNELAYLSQNYQFLQSEKRQSERRASN